MQTPSHLDTLRCKHCDAVVALLPARSIVGRAKLSCPQCEYENVYYPPREPLKASIDNRLVISYSDSVPA